MPNLYHIGNPRYFGDTPVLQSATRLKKNDPVAPGDVVVTAGEFDPNFSELLIGAKQQGAVTLHLADGILEWRNSFEHPPRDHEGVGSRIWQPVLADYFMALGDAQKRTVETWGNEGRCHVLGAPRLEPMVTAYSGKTWPDPIGPRVRVLIASALKYGVGAVDKHQALKAYRDLRDFLHSQDTASPVQFKPVWRVSDDLAEALELTEEEIQSGAGELQTVMEEADVLICGQSTLLLEGMLQKKPVVCLEYTSSPQYVRTAWNIRSAEHIEDTLISLLKPSSDRILFQENELNDQLRTDGSACSRLDEIIHRLLRGETLNDDLLDTESITKPSNPRFDAKDAEILQLRLLLRREREAVAVQVGSSSSGSVQVGSSSSSTSMNRANRSGAHT